MRSTDNSVTTAGDNVDAATGATGGSNQTYTLQAADLGQYLFYCVTPTASTGTSPGAESCSGATAAVVAAPVNGACGAAHGIATAFVPAANLCATGTASAVTVGSPWTWSCTGSGGGSDATNCSAPNATTSTNTGTGRAVISGGTWVVDVPHSAGFIATSGDPSGKSPPDLPSGYTFPHGLFDFTLISGAAGSAASITITYPTALPPATVYWKYGATPTNHASHWYPFSAAVIAGNTITLTITDGGEGDDDVTANSVIVDQGGPGVPDAGGAGTAGIPTRLGMGHDSALGVDGAVRTGAGAPDAQNGSSAAIPMIVESHGAVVTVRFRSRGYT